MQRYNFNKWKNIVDNDFIKEQSKPNFYFLDWKYDKLEELERKNNENKNFVRIMLYITTIVSIIVMLLIFKHYNFDINLNVLSIETLSVSLNLGLYYAYNLFHVEEKNMFYRKCKRYLNEYKN